MSEQGPVVFLRNALDHAEQLARAATPGPWAPKDEDPGDDEVYSLHDGEHGDLVGDVVAFVRGQDWRKGPGSELPNMHLIATAADPVTVLRMAAKARELLAEHAGTWASGQPEFGYHHETVIGEHGRTRYIEVTDDEPTDPYMCTTCQEPGWPCRSVLLLAEMWGWEAET